MRHTSKMKTAIIAGCVVLASAVAWNASRIFYAKDMHRVQYMAVIEFCKTLVPDGAPIPFPNPRNDCLDHLKREFLGREFPR